MIGNLVLLHIYTLTLLHSPANIQPPLVCCDQQLDKQITKTQNFPNDKIMKAVPKRQHALPPAPNANSFMLRVYIFFLIAFLLMGSGASLLAQCGFFVVTNTNDSGFGSLREAVLEANACPATADFPNIIDMTMASGTIVLTSGQINISNHVRLEGPGAEVLSVSGGDSSRIFFIASNSSIEINDLTMERGFATGNGGAIGFDISISITLSINRCKFVDNRATDRGGAISTHQQGMRRTLFLNDCIFENNEAGTGGAISLFNTDGSFQNCQFRSNTASVNVGVLLTSFTQIDLAGCVFENNSSTQASAVRTDNSNLQMDRCIIRSNISESAGGGSLQLVGGTGTVQISNSILSGNQGWGISNTDTLTVVNCSLSGNDGGILSSTGSALILYNNIISDNAGDGKEDLRIISGAITGTNNLISSSNDTIFMDGAAGNLIGGQPCFIKPVPAFPTTEGDLRLRFGSLGIDAGDDNRIIDDLDVVEDDRIQGQAVNMGAYETVVPAPLIFLSGNAMQITNGDASPSPDDDTGFGAIDIGQSVSHTFGIANTGTDVLFLAGMPPVEITGFGADAFSVEIFPGTSIVPGEGTLFTISFSPSFSGFHQATVRIPNNACYDDPFIFEIGGAGNPGVFGNISHWNGEPAPFAQVTVDVNDGQAILNRGVGQDGDYGAFPLPYGASVRITPSESNPGGPSCPDCLDVADLLAIRQHILSVQPLDNPYAIIAADVDNTESISNFDLALIQQMILGETFSFNNNNCWRYVDASFVFPIPEEPWETSFPESVFIDSLFNEVYIDFVAIKTGDATGDCPAIAPPTAGSVAADFNDCVLQGDIINVPVRTSAFNGSGFQFTLSWDIDVLQYMGTGNYNLPGLAIQNFSELNADAGFLTMAWISDDPAMLPAGAILFDISFQVVGPPGSATTISFPDFPTPARTATAFPITTFAPLAVEGLVRVGAQPVFTPLMPREACIDAPAILLSATPSGGTFSGPGIAAGSAVFDPAMAGVGSHTLVYTYQTAGCPNSDFLQMEVLPLPAIELHSNSPVCDGDTLRLEESGAESVDWEWSGPQGFSSAGQGMVALPGVTPLNNGFYQVTVTDAAGCVNNDSIEVLSINPRPFVAISGPASVCESDTLQLQGQSVGATEWHWQGPSLDTTTQSPQLILSEVGSADAGPYHVTVTDGNGCQNTVSSPPITVHALPPVKLFDNLPLCEGETLLLWDTSSTIIEWKWRVAGVDTITQDSILSIPFANMADDGGYYYITITDENYCQNTDSTFIIIFDKPSVEASNNSPLCAGDTLRLWGTETGGVINWRWSGPTFMANGQNQEISAAGLAYANTYTLVGKDGNECTDTATTTVVIHALPPAGISSNSPVCEGEALILRDTSGADSLWQWAGPGLDTTLHAPEIEIGMATPAVSGRYTVTVTDGKGCRNTASIDSALVYARPLVAVSSNSPLCDNEGLELSESGGVAASWNWRGPGGFYSSDNNPFVERADVTPGNFVVTIADSNGCANSASLEVTTVSGFFFESNLLTPSFIFCGDSVHFFDISEAELPDGQYFWDFGDGSSSTERDPVHVYGGSGVYNVTLQVTDANCENLSLEKELTVFGCLQRKLDFLNAYPNPSPDGNVTLEAILNGRSSLAIEVYSPTGVRLERRVLRDVLWARESFTFERSGVYFIYLLAETDREVLKVVVGKG